MSEKGYKQNLHAVRMAIAEDYIMGLGSIASLAEQYEVPFNSVKDWASAGCWTVKRAEYQKNKIAELIPPALPPLFGEVSQTPYMDSRYLVTHAKKFYERLPELQENLDKLRMRIICCDQDKMLPGLVRAYNETMITWAKMLRLPLEPPEGADQAVTEPKSMGKIETVDAAPSAPPPPPIVTEPTGNVEPM